MLKMSEIVKLDNVAILSKVAELRKEIFDMKLQKVTTSIEKPHLLKQNKKNIAKLLTALNSKKVGNE